jgi:hypothetical protein
MTRRIYIIEEGIADRAVLPTHGVVQGMGTDIPSENRVGIFTVRV